MAEEIESPANGPEHDATNQTRRARARSTAPAGRPRSTVARAKSAPATTAPASARPAAKKGRVAKPLRSLVILSMVGGLVATVALPAFAAGAAKDGENPVTLQQMAMDEPQTFVAASDATNQELSRDSYSATTAEEIEKKKAAEAAAERAREAAKRASTASVGANIALTSPGTGEVRWPLTNFKKGRGLWDSGYHQGVDLLTSCGQPIYATAAGVVKVSQESYGGYGVAVSIDHVLGGQRVNSLYGHMTYGSRQVKVGQSVEAGQLIGLVGSTGSSTACHTHFEIHINGSVVDPWAWLQANAG
ncbi:M23 family metallopeptidase [Microbacterium sp. NEAU-LLC]|uniref:M23 family metallopeptidase n=1 Tax=Microbacterium helvum TaxID=2773713 RepID=A0ABR8NQK3_9MICO|nr:M23 family metallopeptidase [Microbacterium helvum]MBD3942743.1 M23 family metallopeptidase [Microbacterium helvum]